MSELDEVSLDAIKKSVTTGGVNKEMQKKKEALKKSLSIQTKKLAKEDFDGMTEEEISELIYNLPLAMQEEAKTLLGLNEKRGLWDNIHAKRKRIKNGSGERMRKPGEEGAPSEKDLRDSQKEEAELDEKQGPCWKGYKKVPGKKDYEDGSCVKEDVEYISEATDKLLYLARIGLVNRNEVVLLRKALKVKSSGETISPRYRDIMLKVMDKLINMVVKNQQMFNRARKEVREEVAVINMFEEVLTEAGYCDPPKNMKEFRKRYPKIAEKIKSTDSGDFNVAVTTDTVSESYSNHLSIISKK